MRCVPYSFAAMWLLMVNLAIYLVIGIINGHFRRTFLPVTPKAVVQDLGKALKGRRDKAVIATKFGLKMGEGMEGARPGSVKGGASIENLTGDFHRLVPASTAPRRNAASRRSMPGYAVHAAADRGGGRADRATHQLLTRSCAQVLRRPAQRRWTRRSPLVMRPISTARSRSCPVARSISARCAILDR